MDCHQRKEELKLNDCTEHLIDTSVKEAMECLQIASSPVGADHRLNSEFGGDCKTDKQTDRQTNENTEEINPSTELSVTQSSNLLSGFNQIEAQEVKNQINREELIDVYSSDSVYDSSSETEGADKREFCEKSGDITENQNNNLNAVINCEPPLVTNYPLKYKWQLWFWRADQGVKVVWEKALQRVCKPFDSVENFWRLYHHIIPVRQLVSPSDYCVFKEGISPMWEDSQNISGGKWTLDFAKGLNRAINPRLDEIWLEVLLCLIGEGFNEFGEDICGAVVNIRSKEDRISVWTANATKSVSNLKIGEILKIRSGYEGQMKYEAHTTAQRIAEAKDRLFDTKSKISSKPKSKLNRRSCVF